MKAYLLTTIDNPFNPFSEWAEWKRYDEEKGYHSLSYMARIAKTSPDLSEADYRKAVENAVDEIVKMNVNGLYAKAYEE